MLSWKIICILYAIFTTIFNLCYGSNEKKLIREYYEKSNYITNSTERSTRTVSKKVSTLCINWFYTLEILKYINIYSTVIIFDQILIRRAIHPAANIFVFQSYTAQRQCQESNTVRKIYQ